MNEINFLRPLIEQELTVAKSKGRNSLYITLAIILVIGASVIVFGARFALSNQSKSLDAQISSLESDVSEAREIEEKIINFNNTITKLKNLNKTNPIWSQAYDNIAKSTPADIKLSQVTLITAGASGSTSSASAPSPSPSPGSTASASKLKLKILGESKSERSIALFQYKLQKIGGNFTTVDIISAKRSTITSAAITGVANPTQTTTNINFEIDITLKSS